MTPLTTARPISRGQGPLSCNRSGGTSLIFLSYCQPRLMLARPSLQNRYSVLVETSTRYSKHLNEGRISRYTYRLFASAATTYEGASDGSSLSNYRQSPDGGQQRFARQQQDEAAVSPEPAAA